MNELPKVGEIFNPYRRFEKGIFIPLSIFKMDLSLVAKLIYARTAGIKGYHNRPSILSRETIARELGVSVATVRRGFSELVDKQLIVRVNLGRGRVETRFLWVDDLAQDGFRESPMTRVSQKKRVTRDPVGKATRVKSYFDTGQKRNAHIEEKVNEKVGGVEASSSSSNGLSKTTTEDHASRSFGTDGPALEHATKALVRHYYRGGVGPQPDPILVRDILAIVGANFDEWLHDLAARVDARSIRGWGFYQTDALQWKERSRLNAAIRAERNEGTASTSAPPEAESACKCGGERGWWSDDGRTGNLCECEASKRQSVIDYVTGLNRGWTGQLAVKAGENR